MGSQRFFQRLQRLFQRFQRVRKNFQRVAIFFPTVCEDFSNGLYQHLQRVAERLFQRFLMISNAFNVVDDFQHLQNQRGVLLTNRLLNDPKS